MSYNRESVPSRVFLCWTRGCVLRLAKSLDSCRRIASESYHRDSNQYQEAAKWGVAKWGLSDASGSAVFPAVLPTGSCWEEVRFIDFWCFMHYAPFCYTPFCGMATLAFVGGHIFPQRTESGIAERLARVDRVRYALAIDDWRFCPSKSACSLARVGLEHLPGASIVKMVPWNRWPPQEGSIEPSKGSIEPLKRFYLTLKGSIEPPFGPQEGSIETPVISSLQIHRQGSIKPFA